MNLQDLTDELDAYYELHNLPKMCALEAQFWIFDQPKFRDDNGSLTDTARTHLEWLEEFGERWDALV